MKKFTTLCLSLLMMVVLTGFVFAAGQQESSDSGVSTSDNLAASLAVDTTVLKAADGQQLIKLESTGRTVPARPTDPSALPETDPLHWWDMEFAGEITNKINIPESPADGAIGKNVTMIVHGDPPGACCTKATPPSIPSSSAQRRVSFLN